MLLSIAAWGDTTATVDGIKYKIDTDKKTATVTYPNDSQPSGDSPSTYSGDITIPSSINYEGQVEAQPDHQGGRHVRRTGQSGEPTKAAGRLRGDQ